MQSTFEEKARIVCHGNCQFMAHTIITTSSKLFDFFEYYLSFCIEWYGDTNLKFSAPQNRRCGELLDLGMSFRYDRGSLEYSSITF